jgi:hypothetical protein
MSGLNKRKMGLKKIGGVQKKGLIPPLLLLLLSFVVVITPRMIFNHKQFENDLFFISKESVPLSFVEAPFLS